MSANNRFVKQTAPKTIHPLNFSPYSTGIQLDISITGPAPLDQWSGNSTAPSSFQSTSMISQSSIPVIPMAAPQPQAPGGSASIPSAVDAASLATLGAVSLPAAVVSVAVNCLFTDDSAKIPYDQQESSYVAGNHGHYEVKLQQLQVNLQGNPSPDPYTGSPTWWADVDTVTGDVLLSNGSVSPAVADLYGAGATAAYAGSNPVAAANANVSTTITLPINLTSVLGVYRFALRYFLGDTRSYGNGYCASTSIDGTGTLQTTMPPDYTTFIYTGGFQLMVVPSGFVQLNYIPVGLIYVPPGSKSNESFQYKNTYTNTVTVSDSSDDTYSVADDIGSAIAISGSSCASVDTGKVVSALQSALTPAGNCGNAVKPSGGCGSGGSQSQSPITLNLSMKDQSCVSSTWDTTTTLTRETTVEDDTTFTFSSCCSVTYTPSQPLAMPGDTAPTVDQPFWGDTFLLMVHPQFAVWEYYPPGIIIASTEPVLFATQLLSAWENYKQVTVYQLNQVNSGAQPSVGIEGEPPASGGQAPTLTLYPSDCASLLALDPFWAGGWQGATMCSGRFVPAGSWQFGTIQPGPNSLGQFGPQIQQAVQIQNVTSNETNNTQTTTLKYTTQIQSKFSLTQSQTKSYNYSLSSVGIGVGGSGSTKTQNSCTSTCSATMSATFQTKTQVDVKSARTVQGSLSDAPPTLQTKSGPNGAPAGSPGSTTLYVNSTEDVSEGQAIVINPPSGQNIGSAQNPTDTEGGTIAAIICGVSLTLQQPLIHTHQNGEQIAPVWSLMNVNAYTDLLFGGLAFQDPNAQKAPPPVPILCISKVNDTTPDKLGSGLGSTIDSLKSMKGPPGTS